MEVVLRQDRGKEEYQQALQDCEQISVETQRLVETLLSLARIEFGQTKVERQFGDLEKQIASSWQPHESQARSKGLRVFFRGPSGVLLFFDAEKLQVVLANLFSNAVEYTDRSGSIKIGWSMEEEGLRLVIANSGCKLTKEQTQRVFDRFWRADTARAATGSHAGLGLSLCKRIVHIMGGIDRRSESGYGLRCDHRFQV